MALINCPECNKEISDKALSCPNCGLPINILQAHTDSITIKESEQVQFPTLPADLNIGQQITNWAFDAAIDGDFDRTENTVQEIPHGKVSIALHTHGVQIFKGLTFYPIHNSQIINIKTASKGEIIQSSKSVIGRAAVGGLILGPLGAVIGGMSGLNKTEKFIDKNYIIINFWDINSSSAQTILISGDKNQIDRFINRHEKEIKINETTNRVAEKQTTPVWAILCLIIIAIAIIIFVFS